MESAPVGPTNMSDLLESDYSLIPTEPSATVEASTGDLLETTESPPYLVLRHPQPNIEHGPEMFIYGFVLVLIPTATILGNFLVIISVLRFKALHSAINFLILGLAVADLMVALFVMPYAVYVYIQNGYWLLGPLMCNLYLSSDVACSTASIILLALISFDRYKAISKPIQYSRQAQDICRVVKLFVGVWIYSFCVASPIVLGFNEPTMADSSASPYECRFYNAYFSLLSSLVSFVLPCCVVIFVYVRIIRALRRREKAAKLRKAQQLMAAQQAGDLPNADCEEAGEIVAGPAVNMMMIALPSLNRQIKRYERHKRALEEVEAVLDDDLSSSESLSEDVRILTNDFLSEVPTNSNSKVSATLEPPQRGSFLIGRFRASFSGVLEPRKKSSVCTAEEIVPSIFQTRKRSACDVGAFSPPSLLDDRRRSGAIVLRSRSNREECRRESRLMPLKEEAPVKVKREQSPKEKQPEKPKSHQPCRPTRSFPLVRRITLGRDIKVNHYLLTGGESRDGSQSSRAGSQKMQNGGEGVKKGSSKRKANGPLLANGNLPAAMAYKVATSLVPPPLPFRRGSSAIDLTLNTTMGNEITTTTLLLSEDAKFDEHPVELVASMPVPMPPPPPPPTQCPNGKSSLVSTVGLLEVTTPSGETEEGGAQRPTIGTNTDTQTLQRGVGSSRRDRHASLRRKVHKSQRKEKRATKTLGIVVGTFLCCWVPFFSLNIVNALCSELRLQWCQVGFGPFFYTTWIGYMNSFMNPVIYTIFNAEFRRAFKSLLLGRRASSGVRRMI